MTFASSSAFAGSNETGDPDDRRPWSHAAVRPALHAHIALHVCGQC